VKVSVLMYHDVVESGDADASGFRGPGPDRYKVERGAFARQLDTALAATGMPPVRLDLLVGGGAPAGAWSLTFDDGGSSALTIAEELTRRGWSGTFFVPTAFVGHAGFVGPDEIRALHGMGQLVGSHSHSHPARISALDRPALDEEWRRSVGELSTLIDAPVTVASVVGGFYSREVGHAAATAGIRVLCTSEPVRGLGRIDDCVLVGRHGVLSGTSAEQVGAIAAGAPLRWARERAGWELRKAAKAVGGRRYLQLRTALLERRERATR
jgi:peptidoglycan/xylan/chitin deacetylase (PgdA/CDA1 family)